MNKNILVILIVVIGCVLAGIGIFLLANGHRRGDLTINEVRILDTPTVVYAKGYAAVPVVDILQAVGFDVVWEDETQAQITGYGQECRLDLETKTLMHKQTVDPDKAQTDPLLQYTCPEYDLLSLKSGGNVYIKERTDRDLLVDDQIMCIALERLGFQATFEESFLTGRCSLTLTYPESTQ